MMTPSATPATPSTPNPAQQRRADIRASFVVFLVALPLALGIAVASGYPPIAGLISGVIGGLLVGALSGAPLQVSGAAAGLAVLCFDGVQRFGLERMGLVVLVAGILQAAFGIARTGRWFQAVSPAVLHGMLAGIGVLIVLSQAHVLLGGSPHSGPWANVAALPQAFADAFAGQSPALTASLALGALAILVMAIWPKLTRGRRLATVPAPLAAVAITAGLAAFFSLPVTLVSIPSDLLTTWRPAMPDVTELWRTPALLTLALQLALIASAESLLCAGALDQMHNGPRTRYDKELTAQGVGNAVCGLLSALPVTGVIVRSTANVQAGASTRLSTILHGVWLLLFIVALPGVLGLIPMAALAGLLVFTGAKLFAIRKINELAGYDRGEVAVFAATAIGVVALDLLSGVLLGLALAGVRALVALSGLNVSCEHRTNSEGPRKEPASAADEVVVRLRGAATFLRLPELAKTLESVPGGTRVVVNAELRHLDHACVEHLRAWRRRHESLGGRVEIQGVELDEAPRSRRIPGSSAPRQAASG